MACPVRKYPLTQPKNWQPPVPRWTLELPEEVTHIFTTYVGVQQHSSNPEIDASVSQATTAIEKWLASPSHAPEVIDTFIVTHGFDIVNSRVWVAYWTDQTKYAKAINHLNLMGIYHNLADSSRPSTGLWLETFTTPTPRLETNYAGLHHRPGLASLPNASFPQHNLTAYWGAARDRMPASAYDLYPIPTAPEATAPPDPAPRGIGQRLHGTNYENIVHIRSGQIWSVCPADESAAYETILEPVLMEGMDHLWTHPLETGTLGLRFLQNTHESLPQKETCGAGFFRNLSDLETWAKRHKSHLAIFNGAHRHARDWGGERKFMTWHEVSVLKEGEARWEYVNCSAETGVGRWVGMSGGVEELGLELELELDCAKGEGANGANGVTGVDMKG